MSAAGEKDESAVKGFAGLSALISDVDAEIAKAKEAIKQPPVSPGTSDSQSDMDSLRESSDADSSREPDQQPSSAPNFVLVDKPNMGSPKRVSQTPKMESTKPEFSIKPSWKGMLAICAIIGLICLFAFRSENKTNSGWTPVPSSVPIRPPSRADSPQSTLAPKQESFKSLGPFAEKPSVAKPDLESTRGSAEEKPPVGTDNVLNAAQIRYCLSEKIRIEGAESVVNAYKEAEVYRFNSMVDDYNSRCAEFRYIQGTLEDIQSGVNARKPSLLADGSARFSITEGSSSLPASGSEYPNQRLQIGADIDSKKVQSGLVRTQTSPTVTDLEAIKGVVNKYYQFVQNKDIDGAMNCYSTDKRPQIKKSRIAAVAKDTEYYKIENVSVAFAGEVNRAKAITSLLHKKYGMKPESWEITLEFTKEAGEWKICATPGHKINP